MLPPAIYLVSLGMKTIILFLNCLLLSTAGMGQQTTPSEPPYKRFPTVPPFKVLLSDSTTWFTREDLAKKEALVIMLFSPECDHCQHQTDSILAHIKEFKQVQFLLVTVLPFDRMKRFYESYGLANYKNIIVGRDEQFLFPGFFQTHSLPVLAFYNRKKELISLAEGSMRIDNMLTELKK